MRQYTKKPLSIAQQINHLLNHDIIIDNKELSSIQLSTIGYYRLSAYFLPFKHKQTKAHFNDIINLYKFDRKLRLIVIDGIEQIEVAIRSQWCHLMATTFDDSHAYTSCQYFLDPWSHQLQLARVSKQINQSTEVFINHYKTEYKRPFLPPIWAMVETLTFGELSKWVTNTNSNQVKKSLAQSVGLPTVEIFQSVLHSLCMIRNICAHHGRLWNRLFVKRLPHIKKLRSTIVTTQPAIPDKTIYNYLVVITHILQSIEPKNPWKAELVTHIKQLSNKQQQTMGFPTNWQELAFWH